MKVQKLTDLYLEFCECSDEWGNLVGITLNVNIVQSSELDSADSEKIWRIKNLIFLDLEVEFVDSELDLVNSFIYLRGWKIDEVDRLNI